jgi:hypothetical protein
VIGVLLALRLLAEPNPASLPIDLTWQAPADCPTQADVTRELERIARARPGLAPARLIAEVTIRRVKDELRLELITERDGRRGSRRLRGADCAALVRGLTLVLALAFGPGVELMNLEPAPPAPVAPSPREPVVISAAAPAATIVLDDEAPPRRGLGVALSAEARSAIGWLPSIALGLGVGARHAWSWGSVGLHAGLWLPERALVGGAEARLMVGSLTLLGCLHPLDATLRLAVCVGAESAFVHGSATGTDRDATEVAPWYGGVARVDAELMIDSPVRPYLSSEVAVGVYRPRFTIAGGEDVHELGWVLPGLALGARIDL